MIFEELSNVKHIGNDLVANLEEDEVRCVEGIHTCCA